MGHETKERDEGTRAATNEASKQRTPRPANRKNGEGSDKKQHENTRETGTDTGGGNEAHEAGGDDEDDEGGRRKGQRGRRRMRRRRNENGITKQAGRDDDDGAEMRRK